MKGLFDLDSQDVQVPTLIFAFDHSYVSADGKILLDISGHSVTVDEEYFSNMFKMQKEGISSFTDVSYIEIEEMQVLFSATGNAFKISEQKRDLKFDYQVLANIVAKGILSKACSFAFVTLEKFQVITAIVKGVKVNWSSILLGIFKNMFQSYKQSKGFNVQL